MAHRIYHYTVRGSGSFPFDMLRYDQAWPSTESDSARMEDAMSQRATGLERREVAMTGLSNPTVGRWESFGWRVEAVSSSPAWV